MRNQLYVKSISTVEGELEKEKNYSLIAQVESSFFHSGVGLIVINDKIQMVGYDSEMFMKVFDVNILSVL